MSPRSWSASKPSSASPSIAKAWSLRSPKRWPVATASCARKRTPSRSVRRRDEPARGVPRHYAGLARGVSAAAHVSPWRAASPGLAGLPGAPLPVPHYLDQRRPEPQLERGVFPALALPLGVAAVISADPETGFGALPTTLG